MNFRIAFLLLSFALLHLDEPASAGGSDGATTEPTTFQSDLGAIRDARNVPALGGLLLQNGEITRKGVAGPVDSSDAWHLGSDTKAMTATLAARLVEQNLITWDTTLADGLPSLAADLHDAHKTVTLRQLLGHRGGVVGGGLADVFLLPQLWGLEEKMVDQTAADRRLAAAKIILSADPVAAPGVTFLYSNYGYVLAGAMLERAGGDSWEHLMQREVFGPLQMTTAGFGSPPRVRGHLKVDGEWVPQTRDNPPTLGPAAVVHCSLADWSKFAVAHLGHGPAGYLTADSLKILHEPLPGDDAKYALGWAVVERDGRTLLAHEGSNTMWYAAIVLDPSRDEARLAVCNAPDAAACYDVLRALDGD